ncbi:hypothetical protein PGB90_002029 [Kerria lacca]
MATGLITNVSSIFFKCRSIVFTQLQAKGISSTMNKFEEEKIVPDVIPVAPKEILKVTYSGGLEVNLGNELTPTQVKDKPSVKFNGNPNSFYTLCMTDPDAPSRKNPKFREWHHWLVGNIPGFEIEKGETLSEYIGSGPPPDTGLHRYVFLVYQQPGKLTFTEPRLTNRSGDNRGLFKISKFAENYKLGNPIAGNFYQAKYDDYVPLLYKQLGA